MSVTVGTNLSVDASAEAKALSKALAVYAMKLLKINEHGTTSTVAKIGKRVFKKAGVPASNTAADSPGQDLCFVVDTTNNDLYLIHTWASSTSFTAAKILEAS